MTKAIIPAKLPLYWKKQRLTDVDKQRRYAYRLFDQTGTLQGYVRNVAGDLWEGYAGRPGILLGLFDELDEAKETVAYCIIGEEVPQVNKGKSTSVKRQKEEYATPPSRDLFMRALKLASGANKQNRRWATPLEITASGKTEEVGLRRAITTDDLDALVRAGQAESKTVLVTPRTSEKPYVTKQIVYRPKP